MVRGYTSNSLDDNRHEVMEAGARETRRQWILAVALVAILVVIAFVRGGHSGGRISAAVNDHQLGISGTERIGYVYELSAISSVELVPVETLDIGERISGSDDTRNLYEGLYYSDTYGDCRLLIGTASADAIVVRFDGSVDIDTLIFTGLSDRDTQNLYKELTK